MADRPYFEHVLPQEYSTAIGEAIVQWAFFEVDMDAALTVMRFHPQTEALSATIPTNLKKRLKLLRDSIETAFASYPAALPRLRSISQRASQLARNRNDLAHARWVESRNDAYTSYNVRFADWGDLVRQEWTLDRIRKLTRAIGETHAELDIMMGASSPMRPHWFLSSDEISAMQQFRIDNLPHPPTPRAP